MLRTTLIVLVLLSTTAIAQPPAESRNPKRPGRATREARLNHPALKIERNIPYAANDNPRQQLDLYLPKERKTKKLPVIVFIHGGGWKSGSKNTGALRLMPFIKTGHYAGVSVAYRLSGEAVWPAQIHDVKGAIRWIRANAAKYDLDPDHIAVWGTSAGGHLALMIGLTGDTSELDGKLGPHTDVSSKVAGVVNYFGPTELIAMTGRSGKLDRTKGDSPVAQLFGGPTQATDEKSKQASPVTYASANDPPVLTIHGDADHIVPLDQAVRLDTAMKKAGVTHYFITIEGGGHGKLSTAADEPTARFFAKYLRGIDEEIPTGKIPMAK
ncbi:MAG: alpha/beta hydrolase [Planctomycetota bacterium]|nr:alpha/beta hydrolase [Planctomycetota bacterium]